jgi:hypothetical protein
MKNCKILKKEDVEKSASNIIEDGEDEPPLELTGEISYSQRISDLDGIGGIYFVRPWHLQLGFGRSMVFSGSSN